MRPIWKSINTYYLPSIAVTSFLTSLVVSTQFLYEQRFVPKVELAVDSSGGIATSQVYQANTISIIASGKNWNDNIIWQIYDDDKNFWVNWDESNIKNWCSIYSDSANYSKITISNLHFNASIAINKTFRALLPEKLYSNEIKLTFFSVNTPNPEEIFDIDEPTGTITWKTGKSAEIYATNNYPAIYIPSKIGIVEVKNFYNIINGDQNFNKVTGRVQYVIIDPSMNITTLPDYTFKNTCIQRVVLPNNLEIIGKESFYQSNYNLFNLSNLNKLIEIKEGAFKEVNVGTNTCVFPESLSIIGNDAFSFFQCGKFNLSSATSLLTIGESAFEQIKTSSNIFDLVLPNLVSIGQNAFKNLNQLNSLHTLNIDIPYNTTIYDNAFQYNNFNRINCNYSIMPIGYYTTVFSDSTNPNGNLSNKNFAVSSNDLLEYFKTRGIPSTWTSI